MQRRRQPPVAFRPKVRPGRQSIIMAEGSWLAAEAFAAMPACFKKQWRRHREALAKCRRKFSEKSVHDSRVETRRLLSVIELLAPVLGVRRYGKARAALKHHLDLFDELRDTHVQLELARPFAPRFAAVLAVRKYLRKAEERAAKQTRKRIRRRWGARRLETLLAACKKPIKAWQRECLPAAGVGTLRNCLAKAFDDTRRRLEGVRADEPETVHFTRVAFKRFRYMVELLAPHLRFATAARLRALHQYQTMMGDIQDVRVLMATLDKLAAKGKLDAAEAAPFRRALEGRRRLLTAGFLAHRGKLDRFWPGAGHRLRGGKSLA